ncbi:membrane protein insertion efficiency factor YidD [Limosilactobacillus caecicola]|uniref:membrane protein insertion efficiency factor YidD n=1 Tax=Limosilactobacillus caecicola TaxID=2941332 RepID=UPI00203AEF91|nr:membrane protein insertion efficiency factor YidD [Limosilactobacillus caecicola]
MVDTLIQLIRCYQHNISIRRPFKVCRYEPTCSEYMVQALQRFGMKGALLGFARILRCHPFAKGGFDPVPLHFTFKSYLNR